MNKKKQKKRKSSTINKIHLEKHTHTLLTTKYMNINDRYLMCTIFFAKKQKKRKELEQIKVLFLCEKENQSYIQIKIIEKLIKIFNYCS